jgi:hypothetical protein
VPCITPLLGWITAGLPLAFSFLSLLINNMVIFCFVRKTVQKAYRHSSDLYESGQTIAGSSASSPSHFFRLGRRRRRSTLSPDRPVDSQTRRVQTVAVQAALYVLAFILNYTWTTALKIIGANERYWTDEHESDLFGWLVMQAIFLPCQGVFNVIVFNRPKYRRIRKSFPDQSRIWAFNMALFGAEKLPPKKRAAEGPKAEGATTSTGMTSHKEVKSPPLCQVKEAEEDEDMVDAEDGKGDTGVLASAVPSSPPEDLSTSKILTSASMESSGIPRSKNSVRSLKGLSKHFSSRNNVTESNDKGLFSSSVGPRPRRPLRASDIDSFLYGTEDYSEFQHSFANDGEGTERFHAEGAELRKKREEICATGSSQA